MITINRLIELNIEIEGLLHVLESRDNDTAQKLLNTKFNEFKELFEQLNQSSAEFQESMSEHQQPGTPDEAIDIIEIPKQEYDDDIIPDGDIVIEQDPELDDNTDESITTVIEQDPDIDNQPIEIEHAPEPVIGDNLEEHTLMPPTDNVVSRESVEENTETTQVESENAVEAITFVEDETPDASKDNIRVDEMLSRREARDLRRAFTLNDKFRFRRELFGNNDSLFADTLNTLMAMKTIDEASEYLYEDMGWDKDNEDVADFVAIVRNHFAGI